MNREIRKASTLRLVVATHSFLALVEIDTNWQISDFQVLGQDHYYGIALPQAEKSQFITKNDKSQFSSDVSTNESNLDYQAQDCLMFNSDEYREIHQIAYCDKGLYVANTLFNTLEFLSLDQSIHQQYVIDGRRVDHNHVYFKKPALKLRH